MSTVVAEEIDTLYQHGLDALRLGENVAAIKVLARAVELAEKSGDDARATDINSMMFYARKKLNLQQINELTGADSKAAAKAETVISRKADPTDADKALQKAISFASAHQDDQLLIAIKMFEVASMYKGTDAGFKAMDLSLAAMQKIPAKVVVAGVKNTSKLPSLISGKIGVTIEAGSGYTVETMREGASVFSNQSGSLWSKIPVELDGKNYTQVPSGNPQGIKLRFDGADSIFFLIDPSWGPTKANIAAIKKLGGVQVKNSIMGGINKHQLWSIVGKPGQVIDLPVQIIVASDKISLDKIP